MTENNKKVITLIDAQPEEKLAVASGAKAAYIFFITPDFKQNFESNQIIKVGDQAEVDIYYCYLSQYNIKVNLEYYLGNQARIQHHLLFVASAEQLFSFQDQYVFQGQNTFGRFITRGLVQDKAQAICDGNIIIRPGAQQTDAYLDMQGVIMDREARIKMIPGLQIAANNVKASHAARLSMLDDEQLFYLRSRGLDAKQAKNLFIGGMFGELVKQIPDQNIQIKILEIIRQKLYGRD